MAAQMSTPTMDEPALRLRRAGAAGGAAFLLLATSLLLPWWVVSNRAPGSATVLAAVYPLGSGQGIVHPWAQVSTGAVVGAPIVLLFVRVASRAWAHEPAAWRRDIAIAALLVLAALASGMLWPTEIPFWGVRTYVLDNGTGAQLDIIGNPGLGWWLAAVACSVLAAAWWASRPQETKG
jgi:hypothetical protein